MALIFYSMQGCSVVKEPTIIPKILLYKLVGCLPCEQLSHSINKILETNNLNQRLEFKEIAHLPQVCETEGPRAYPTLIFRFGERTVHGFEGFEPDRDLDGLTRSILSFANYVWKNPNIEGKATEIEFKMHRNPISINSTIQSRQSICQKCTKKKDIGVVKICAECGCLIAWKTRLVTSRCPLGKW
jgi:hypothetical protein